MSRRLFLSFGSAFILTIGIVTPVVAGTIFSELGTGILGENAGDEAGWAVDLSSDGRILAVGEVLYDSGLDSAIGRVRVFEWNGSTWEGLGAGIVGEAAGDGSGSEVSLNSNGTRLAIAANANAGGGTRRGSVRVFDWDGTAWSQVGSDIDGEADQDRSGTAIALSADGTRLAIGAGGNDGNGSNSGHVRVYEWDSVSSSWSQLGSDLDGEAAGDNFGNAVSLNADGTILAAGAPINSGAAGAVSGHTRVFRWDSGTSTWSQIGSDIDGEHAGDWSGDAVSLNSDGTLVAIGAENNSDNGADAGQVRVFQWTGGAWVQRGSDIDGTSAGDYAGDSVSLSSDGRHLIVGAPLNSDIASDAGQARVFDWNGTAWAQLGTTIYGEAEGDRAGFAVAISDDGGTFAVGSYLNDESFASAGKVRVFSILSTSSGHNSSETSAPGIFLTIIGEPGSRISAVDILAGAFEVSANSPYLLSLRRVDPEGTITILSSGVVDNHGNLEVEEDLPALNPGNYTVTFTGKDSSGALLTLGNEISVTNDFRLKSVTPESLQPTIR